MNQTLCPWSFPIKHHIKALDEFHPSEKYEKHCATDNLLKIENLAELKFSCLRLHRYFFPRRLPGQHEPFDRSTMLSFGILVGLLTALVCVIIGIVAAMKIRTANNKKSNNKQRPGNLPIKEKISVPLSQSEEMYDEKNPDVVPSNEGKNKM